MEQSSALLAAEREAAVKALSAELTRTLAFLQEERLSPLKQLTTERITAVQELGALAVQERKLLTQDIDGLAVKAVDRASLRATQLCAAVLIAVFCAIIVLLMVARRVFFGLRHSGDDPRSRNSLALAI